MCGQKVGRLVLLAALGLPCSDAELPIRTRTDFRRLAAIVVALVAIAELAVVLARVVDGAGVAVVCVDTAQDATVDGDDVGEGLWCRKVLASEESRNGEWRWVESRIKIWLTIRRGPPLGWQLPQLRTTLP